MGGYTSNTFALILISRNRNWCVCDERKYLCLFFFRSFFLPFFLSFVLSSFLSFLSFFLSFLLSSFLPLFLSSFILHYNMYYFHLICKNFLKLTCVLAEPFRCHVHHSQCLTVKHWEWCTWHRKASAKRQVSSRKFLQSEVKIIHIIVQNNTYYNARSRWTKRQH